MSRSSSRLRAVPRHGAMDDGGPRRIELPPLPTAPDPGLQAVLRMICMLELLGKVIPEFVQYQYGEQDIVFREHEFDVVLNWGNYHEFHTTARLPEHIRRAVLTLTDAPYSLVDASTTPDYTGGITPDETGGTVGDARENFALAAKAVEKAFENGLSVADLYEAIEDKLAAKMGGTARETTNRATAEQRPPETAPVAEREPPRPAQQRTAQELFGMSASTPARRYHKSDGPEFCEAELADRVLLAAAEATRNEMKTRAKTEVLTTEERARWQRAGRFVYHARK